MKVSSEQKWKELCQSVCLLPFGPLQCVGDPVLLSLPRPMPCQGEHLNVAIIRAGKQRLPPQSCDVVQFPSDSG